MKSLFPNTSRLRRQLFRSCLFSACLFTSASLPAAESLPARAPERHELWVPTKAWQTILEKHPNAVMLTPEQYQALILDAGKTKLPPPDENLPQRAVVEGMHFKANATDENSEHLKIEGEMTIHCLTDEWTEITARMPFRNLASATVDGGLVLGLPEDIKGDRTQATQRKLLVRGKGRHRISMVVLARPGTSSLANTRSFAFQTVEVPAVLDLQLPKAAVITESTANYTREGDTAHVLLHAGDGGIRQIAWTTSSAITQPARQASAVGETAITDHSIETAWNISIQRSTTDTSNKVSFDVIPADAIVLTVEGEGIVRWQQTGAKLDITLRDRTHVLPLRARIQSVLDLQTSPVAQSIAIPVLRFAGELSTDVATRIVGVAEGVTLMEYQGSTPLLQGTLSWNPVRETQKVLLRKADPRITVDADAHISVTRDDVQIDRMLQVQTDRLVNELRVSLPAGEEFIATSSAQGPAVDWKRVGQVLEYRWPEGLGIGKPSSLKLQSRKRLTNVSGAPTASSLTVASLTIPEAKKLAGYVALDFDPTWRVVVKTASGLEERDARITPVRGKMAWFALRDFSLAFEVQRRAPVFDSEVTAYALPRAKTVEIEGQITLTVSDAPLRQFKVSVTKERAALVRFTSPLVSEQTLDATTGEWSLTLRKESIGTIPVRFRLSLPADGKSMTEDTTTPPKQEDTNITIDARLPSIAVISSRRSHGVWVVEANTDTELTFVPQAMQPLDVLHAPTIDDYQPRHRLVAAFDYAAPEAALTLHAARHDHSELAALVVNSMSLASVLSSDGSSRHQAVLEVAHSGEQFVSVALPKGSTLISSLADNAPVKPVRGANGTISIPLPAGSANRPSVEVRLLYETPGEAWAGRGQQHIEPPTLPGNIPVLNTDWQVYTPDGYTIRRVKTDLQQEGTGPPFASTDDSFFMSGGAEAQPDLSSMNMAITPEVQLHLRAANSHQDLGQYDNTIKEFQEILRLDPYNTAARRGMEKAEQRKRLYYQSARDHKRSMMTQQVDTDWEEQVSATPRAQLVEKMRTLRFPQVTFSGASVEEAIEFLRSKSKDLDTDPDTAKRGVNIILKSGDTPNTAQISLDLKDVPLEEALRYVTELAGMKFKVETNGVVVVVPVTESNLEMVTRVYKVPPDFLTPDRSTGALAAAPADPFAASATAPTLGGRKSAKDILIENGIPFPEGASAVFNPETSQLVVRNTAPNLDIVGTLTEAQPMRHTDGFVDLNRPVEHAKSAPGARREGLLSLDIDLPASGQLLYFHGPQAPTALSLPYVSADRQIIHAMVFMLIGAVLFLAFGWRRPVLATLLVFLLLALGVGLISEEWQPVANATLIGWVIALAIGAAWKLVKAFDAGALEGRQASSTTKWAAFFLVLCSAPALRAETPPPLDPAAHTVFIPFDSSKLIKDQKPASYCLDRADFERLWAQAKENRKPEKVVDGDDDKSEAILTSALYRASIEDEKLVIEAYYDVTTRGRWAKTKLAVDESLSKDPLPLHEVIVDGKPGTMANGEVTFEKAGHHTVQATFDLVRERGWKKVALSLPPSRAAMLLLKLAVQDALPAFADQKLVAVEETVNQERVVTVGLGSSASLQFERVQRRTVSDVLPPSADLTVTTSLTGEMRFHGMVQAHFVFPGSARKQVALTIDPDWTLDAAPTVTSGQQSVRDLRVSMLKEGDKQVLTATFPHEVSDEVTLNFHLTPKLLSPDHTPYVAPKAGRWETIARLLAQDSVLLVAKPADSQRRLANEDYAYTSGKTRLVLPLIRYRLGSNDTLAFESKPADAKTEARTDYVYQLSEQKQELAAAITLTRERGAWRQLRIGLPDGMDIQSVQGPQLSAWELQGHDLFLRFNEATGSEAKVVVYVANTVLKASRNWTLEPLRLEGIQKVSGSAIIAAHAAVEARLDGFTADHDLRETDPANLTTTFTITSPLEKKRAIAFERADWKLRVALQDLPVRFSADAILLTQATEGGVLLSQQIGLIVEQGALKRLVVKLPKSLPEATVTGDQLRDVQSHVTGSLREYECTFQSQGGLLGRAALTFNMELPLTDAELSIPSVEVSEAERLRRWFVLDNSSNRETKTLKSDGVDACAKDALPYVPEVLTQPQFYQGRNTGGLKVAFTQLQATSGNTAIITLADITTVLRADGERWDTVVYSISNRSLQFLPVILPEKAELMAVSVSGEPVRADEEKRDGKRVRLIPLIQTRAGERSMEIRLVYRIEIGTLSKQLRLDDPDLVGLSAERTVWTASLPKGWTLDNALHDTFGNMEPIAEEGRQIEKLQSWMSDLGRINRAVSSSKDAEFNDKALKEADKLNKQIAEVTQQMENKSKNRYDYGGNDNESKQSEKYASKLGNDISKVKEELGKQVVVLTENRVSQGVFSKRSMDNNNGRKSTLANGWADNLPTKEGSQGVNQRYAEYQGLVVDAQEKSKEMNKLSGQAQVKAKQELEGKVQKAKQLENELRLNNSIPPQSVGLNDNVAVNNDFFKVGDGTLTLTGGNTFTGAVTLSGGTLTSGNSLTKSGSDSLTLNSSISPGTTALQFSSPSQSSNAVQGTTGDSLNAFGASSNARANNMTILGGFASNGMLGNSSNVAASPMVSGEDAMGGSDLRAAGVAGGGQLLAARATPVVKADAIISEGTDQARKQKPPGRRSVQIPSLAANLPAAKIPAPPPAPAAAADPFAAPMPAEQSATGKDRADGETATLAVNQLRPTGRHSLQVEVPLTGETWHFRKLKDHAILDLPLKQEWQEGKTGQATVFGLGLGAWALLALFTERRRKRA